MKLSDYKKEISKQTRKNSRVEGGVSSAIEKYLNLKGVWNTRLQSGQIKVVSDYRTTKGESRRYERWMKLGEKGCPDRFLVFKGFAVFAEIKKPGKTSTEAQVAQQQKIIKAGAFVIETDSLDDFIEKFEKVKGEIERILK